jgi:uncharacterized damage-inducible protein DinB
MVEILSEWSWARGLSKDLLNALPEEMLHQQPLPDVGSWAKQFRHLGRVQENYIQALKSGKTVFSYNGCSLPGVITKPSLIEYLSRLDSELHAALVSPVSTIDWFGESWSIDRHLQAMISHEILHHGQLILYARIAKFKLPKSWEAWGE